MKTDAFTRRRLLASMPAVAAIAAPAAATALGGLPACEDDPVFAAIERHRQAFKAYKVTGEITARLYSAWEEQQDPRGFYLGEYPEIKREVTGEIHALQFRGSSHRPHGATLRDVSCGH